MTRAMDLVSRLTSKELIQQTSSIAPAIPRFGIKDYNWRSNCLHGWAESGGHFTSDLKWTVFPAPIGLGATFNSELVNKVAKATSDEGRALHNEMLKHFNGSSTEAAGLNCFSPNVNLFRDPRWGRGMETFGEDPYLISVIGNAYTHGLQEGEDPKYLKVGACAKHYSVHSGPEELRLRFSANTTLRDLYDTYLPAFKSQVIGAHVSQMMPAYSGLRCTYQPDGAPDAANPFLIKTVLRDEFGAPNISVISDNGGVSFVTSQQHYTKDSVHGAAVCMNATTDLDLGHDNIYPTYLESAINEKLVDIESIKQAVTRSFYLRMRLGDFDPPSMVAYQSIDKTHLDTPINQELNLQSARESIVLLKNLDNSLPLDKSTLSHIAVVGPNADATKALLSDYQGTPSKIVSVFDGIQKAVKTGNIAVNHSSGCSSTKCKDTSKFDETLKVSQGADVIIAVMGLDESIETEGHDRANTTCNGMSIDNIALPGCQEQLIEQLAKLKIPIVLVFINGGPVTFTTLFKNDAIVGALEAFYPGAQGGNAVADVLFGAYNPGGRMPVTVYSSVKELPPSVDYTMYGSIGRTYRYYLGEPLIPFGYGLSYTAFNYSNLTIFPSTVKQCNSINVSVTIVNTGKITGDEVTLVYLKPPKIAGKTFPNIELVAFDRATILAGASRVVRFMINAYMLSLVDQDGIRYLFPGTYTIQVDKLEKSFTISGTAPMPVAKCSSAKKCMAC